jgi:predicted AlkP superfamily pyrophosphatase or phosphodiesterase
LQPIIMNRGNAMKRLTSLLIVIVVLEILTCGAGNALVSAERLVAAKPRLVITIVVDQFRYDYLLRFNDDYKYGLRQLMTGGAVFTNARYGHYPTFTSVGHAALLTGAYPSVNGIVGNQWYDRYSGKVVQSAADPSFQIVGGTPGPGASPNNLLVSTVGDELKIASQGQSKVFGISLKDYSGILATGHMADAVYWFDVRSGSFVTSTYFQRELPQWMKAFNAKHPADKYKQADWMGTKLPDEAGPALYGMLQNTPFGNELLEEAAEEAIKAENLGRRAQTDLLVLSFSSNDYVGHQNGPDSPKVRDISIATDRLLGKFFKFVDAQLGLSNAMIVFTADHGVAPMPEINVERKMPGGRGNFPDIRDAVQKALTQKYGEGKWIASTPEDSIYLNWDLIRENNLAQEDVAKTAAQAAIATPHVFRVYTREQLLRGNVVDDLVGRRVMRSFSQQRGADLYVLWEPYYISMKMSTTHGSAFGYDTHVPLIFMGAGIKPGRLNASIAINDVAPTLATILGVEIPSGSEGRILEEIFMAH